MEHSYTFSMATVLDEIDCKECNRKNLLLVSDILYLLGKKFLTSKHYSPKLDLKSDVSLRNYAEKYVKLFLLQGITAFTFIEINGEFTSVKKGGIE